MATDQEFIKKEYKHASTFEKILIWGVPIGSIIIGIVATLFLFVFKPDQPCHPIDPEGAWCAVHPFMWWDFIGVTLFYIALLWLSSIIPRFLIAMDWLEDDSNYFPLFNILAFLGAIGGFLLMYLV